MAGRRPSHLRVVDTSDGNPTGEARPIVELAPGERSAAIDRAEEYLIERDPLLFERGDEVVIPAPQEVEIGGGETASALRIVPVGKENMRERFTRAVDLRKFDAKAKKWKPIDCPPDLAGAYL